MAYTEFMPHRNTIRKYFSGGYYHVYNRGVEKRDIFIDPKDYATFLSLIESYLTPKPPLGSVRILKEPVPWRSKLKKNEIEIICFALMSNHFHLLVKQNSKDGVTKFMRRVITAYVGYFNEKYQRIGALFQGKFRAVLIEKDEYLLHLSRYIHLNPLEVGPLNEWKDWLIQYPYSSYPHYLKRRMIWWLNPDIVLNFFKHSPKAPLEPQNITTYKNFVEGYVESDFKRLKNLILE